MIMLYMATAPYLELGQFWWHEKALQVLEEKVDERVPDPQIRCMIRGCLVDDPDERVSSTEVFETLAPYL